MKTEIASTESVVLEDTATLSPPARVALPALGHRVFQRPARSLENLHKLAKRISLIRPTVETRKDVPKPRKTRAVISTPKARPEKEPKPKIYERLSQAFD